MSEFLIFLQIVMMILFIIYLFNSNKNNYSKVNIIDKENTCYEKVFRKALVFSMLKNLLLLIL